MNEITKKLVSLIRKRRNDIIVFAFVAVLLCLSVFALVGFNYFLFEESFGDILTPFVKLSIILAFIVDFAIFESYIFLKEKIKNRINIWILLTVLIMITSFTIGVGFISDILGKTTINLVLRDSNINGAVVGNITCLDDSKNLLVGRIANCSFYPLLHNFSVNVTLSIINGSSFTETTRDSVYFTPLSDVKRIAFSIAGLDENNSSRKLEVSNDITFYTQDETSQRDEKRIIYFLALLGVIAISIPNMMVNFRRLYENRKD